MVTRSAAAILLLTCLVFSGSATAEPPYLLENGRFRVPLTITDNSGFNRTNWPVTSGIPLPAGAVSDPGELTVLDDSGAPVPAQFRVLSRYTARDNSLRWVLVDVQVSLEAFGSRQLYLTNTAAQATSAQNALVIREDGDVVSVNTGPLQATVSARNGHVFERVVVDGNTIIGPENRGEPFLHAKSTDRFRHYAGGAWNTHGWQREEETVEVRLPESVYVGRTEEARVVIEEQGPLRTTLRLRGRFRPRAGSSPAARDDYYNYTLRLNFYAGQSYVGMQFDVENSSPVQPQWNLPFLAAGFSQDTALDGTAALTVGMFDPGSGKHDFFHAPAVGGTTFRLDQGAPGKSKKKQVDVAPLSTARFLAGGEVLERGNIARFMDISDARKGVTLGMRYFWQEAPRAIEFEGHRLDILALSREFDSGKARRNAAYDLDFAQRYINDLLLYFHGADVDERASLAIVEGFEYPLAALAPGSWYADSETWYFEIDRNQVSTPEKQNHWTTSDPHSDFRRERDSYNAGGHHESLNSSWLSFLLTRRLSDYERLLANSRWHISRNPGWAYRDNVIGGAAADSLGEIDRQLRAWDRLAGFGPKNFYLWRDENNPRSGGRTYFNRYKQLPDIEHYADFILFEYYYLTGDFRALDAIHGFVNWAMNFEHRQLFGREVLPLSNVTYLSKNPIALRRGHYSRIYSWMLYSTLAGYHTTASPVMDHFVIWQIRRGLSLLRHRHGQFTSWDVKPGLLLAPFGRDFQTKITSRIDFPLITKHEAVSHSNAKSWMEAQNALAFHEAYKTYQDERILDGLWGMADYLAHHVIFFPNLPAFTITTSMPMPWIDRAVQIAPELHDRHIQVLPILFHYTGWQSIKERYDSVQDLEGYRRIGRWFSQTAGWETATRRKSSNVAPDRITDLEAAAVDDDRITLRWTSPRDDGPSGHASRYFVKVSSKPIVEYAPTDNPRRDTEKARIINEIEQQIMARKKYVRGRKRQLIRGVRITPEARIGTVHDPSWELVDAFWMAEHVDGEPAPAEAGQREEFVVRDLNLHDWFGIPAKGSLRDLHADRVYLAICSWDEDRNLSALSNVVEVELP